MSEDGTKQSGLKWTNIPTTYAILIIAVIVVVIFGSVVYGPIRLTNIAVSINESLKDKPVFSDVIALPEAGITLRGRVATTRDLAELHAIVEENHTLPVYVNYRVLVNQ
jgi:hypothetical protein